MKWKVGKRTFLSKKKRLKERKIGRKEKRDMKWDLEKKTPGSKWKR